MDYTTLFPTETGAIAFPSVEELARTWADAIRHAPDRRTRVLVATQGPFVVGFACVSAESQESDLIDPLHVGSEKRREGHATRLMAAIAETSREFGAHALSAWALEGDHPWTNLLADSGFTISGQTRTLDLYGDDRVVLIQHRWHAALEEQA